MKKEDVERAIAQVALEHVAKAAEVLITGTLGGEQKVVDGAVDRFRNGVLHARGCEQAMHEIVGHLFDEVKSAAPSTPSESDDSYRQRLKREIGAGSIYWNRLDSSKGAALDE